MTRIVFLNRFFYPDHSATSQMLSGLAFALVARGYAVQVIASRQVYDNAAAALAPFENIAGVKVHRVWSTRFGGRNLALRALDYLTFYPGAAWRLWKSVLRGDIVVAKTDPPLIGAIAAPIAWLRGAVFVNWFQDVFPEVALALGTGGACGRLFLEPMRYIRNLSLRNAALSVALGEAMARTLREQGSAPGRVVVIPNWSDGILVRPVEPRSNALRAAWGMDGVFVVGYSGNLGRAHEFDAIADAMSQLDVKPATASPILFLFVGGGALHERLRQEIGRRRLRNVLIQPYQPVERLAETLSVPDVHLVSLKPELEGLVVPSKLYGILAAGRPSLFIGDPEGEVACLLRDGRCGFTTAPRDGAALAGRIVELAGDSALRHEMGLSARALFEARFEKAIAIERWELSLAGLVDRASTKPRNGA